MGIFGIAKRGLGLLGRKKIKPVVKESVDLTDDGGPYVRRKIAQAKAGKAKGEIKNKAGHVVGIPHKERSAEAIKKYHGIK